MTQQDFLHLVKVSKQRLNYHKLRWAIKVLVGESHLGFATWIMVNDYGAILSWYVYFYNTYHDRIDVSPFDVDTLDNSINYLRKYGY